MASANKSNAAKAAFTKEYKSGKMTKVVGTVDVGGLKSGIKAVGKALSKAPVKKLAEPISHVRVKPAAKQVGNPPNTIKAREEMYSSASRGGIGIGPLGKSKTARTFTSTKPTADLARAAALRAAKNKALANSAKGKTQTPTAEAARRRNVNK